MAHNHTQPVLGALIVVAVVIVGLGLFVVTTTETPVQFAGYPVVVFGALVVGGSVIVVLQKPSKDYVTGLTESDVQTVARPATIIPFSRAIGWFLAGLVGVYLLTTETIPLLWPAILTVVGPYFHAKNVAIVWRNSLTRYYVTDREVIRIRKFLTVSETETGITKVTDIKRTRGVFQRLIGYGDVVVESSSGGSSASIRARSIKSPDKFKQIIKQSQQRFRSERSDSRRQPTDA